MPRILHTGFDNINDVRSYAADSTFENILDSGITSSQIKLADLILLGPNTRDLVKLVQSISRADQLISTMVLPEEAKFNSVKQSLLFAPYMSKHASIVHLGENLREEIPKAATLTRQRRQFAKITANLEAEKPAEKSSALRLEHLGNFLDQAPISAIILNSDFKIVAMNVFARQMFNLAPLTTIRTLDKIFDQVTVNAIKEQLSRKSATRVIEVSSAHRYYEVHFAEITNESSDDLEILLISDITEKKLENQRIRNVLDSLPQMAWTTNSDGEVTYFTNGWYRFTGQSYTTSMGNGWLDVIHEDDKQELIETWEASVKNGKFYEKEARYRRHDGVYRWHLVRGTPILTSADKVSFWLGTCTDIHDQKEVQNDLTLQVEERTHELTEVNELLKKSNNDLRQFAYVASHDLKEPVRKIKIFLDRYKNSPSPEKKEEFIQKINDAAVRMSALIEGIMAYSEVSGGLQFETIELNEVLQNVLADLEMIIQEKGGRVTCEPLPAIRGVQTQITQLFSNLILNSLKYSERKPVISISGREVKGDTISDPELAPGLDYVEVTVEDNGIGFDKKYTEEIFMMFKRLHNKDEYSGAGIGLALVKKIVTNHGGFIKVESEPDKGSRFTIYLPLSPIAAAASRVKNV